jgi:hypothetical protein
MHRFAATVFALVLLAGCGTPVAIQSGQSFTLPRQPTAIIAALSPTAPAPTARAQNQGAHSYEGDAPNSITIAPGDLFTIHNPDFSRGYTFRVVAISDSGITVATDEPNVTIAHNGGVMPYFIHTTESYASGYELPIGWVRFTPREHRPVAQTYSAQGSGTIERSQDAD